MNLSHFKTYKVILRGKRSQYSRLKEWYSDIKTSDIIYVGNCYKKLLPINIGYIKGSDSVRREGNIKRIKIKIVILVVLVIVFLVKYFLTK